jgi:hypothetical protein
MGPAWMDARGLGSSAKSQAGDLFDRTLRRGFSDYFSLIFAGSPEWAGIVSVFFVF